VHPTCLFLDQKAWIQRRKRRVHLPLLHAVDAHHVKDHEPVFDQRAGRENGHEADASQLEAEQGQFLNAMAVGLDTVPDRERMHRPADAHVAAEHDVLEEGVPVGHMVEHLARILQAGGRSPVWTRRGTQGARRSRAVAATIPGQRPGLTLTELIPSHPQLRYGPVMERVMPTRQA
jgi:hypothetical protein